jgi:hypothetical protein
MTIRTRNEARAMGGANKFGDAVIITDRRIEMIKAAIATPGVNKTAYDAQILPGANRSTVPNPLDPWEVADVYGADPTASGVARGRLQNDANRCYMLGLQYRITGDESYAVAAAAHIRAWSGVQTFSMAGASLLSWNVHIAAMIFGADLIKASPAFTQQDRDAFAALLIYTRDRYPAAFANMNNWGAHGLVFESAASVWLKDKPRFDRCVAQWKRHIDEAILLDGTPFHEVMRQGAGIGNGDSGLWYSHYTVMPLIYCAEIFRTNGVYLYDYIGPQGTTLKALYLKTLAWAAHPETFFWNTSGIVSEHSFVLMGHIEMMQNLWPTADGAALLAQLRPVEGRHHLVGVTATHGNLPISG